MVLNLGCGKKFPNVNPLEVLNVDLRQTKIVHVIADANRVFPFRDCSFDNCFALDIIEHLDNVISVVDEIHRVIKHEGKLMIRTAAWDTEQSYADPTHQHWFNLQSFDFFDPATEFGTNYDHYTDRKWKVLARYYDGSEICFELKRR